MIFRQKRLLFPVILLMLILSLSLEKPLRADAGAVSAYGRLSIRNGKVVGSNGKTFVIKGISTHGLAWFPEYVNKNTFKSLRDLMGINTIRLALYSSEYGGYCSGGSKTRLKELIDTGVKAASELDMYVVIDWHILRDGNPLKHKKEAKNFFAYAAKKYAGYKNVLYEICNEPNGSGGSWKNIKKYAKLIIPTIRKYDKNAIIIVGTPNWSQDVDTAMASPITGYKNIAYAFHFYAGTHQDYMRSKLERVLKRKFPVIVSEFGISDASGNGKADTTQGNKWMRLLNNYNVGRICWSISNKAETCSLLKASCKKTSGFKTADLSKSGKWLRKAYKN